MATVKMALYGEPGVGKSTFAYGAPKPFFITTDGNYEYLMEDLGADPNSYHQVYSFEEFNQYVAKNNFDGYDTIVVDLLEDLYLWATDEFCIKNNVQHLNDLGYGKGYDILAREFFISISKLIAKPKNIILLMHSQTKDMKDKYGVAYQKVIPTGVRDAVLTRIEGRLNYFLYCYAVTKQNSNGDIVINRFLSLAPDGTTEYGITRKQLPQGSPKNIPLEWDEFYNVISTSSRVNTTVKTQEVVDVKVEEPKVEEPKKVEKKKVVVEEPKKVEEPKVEETKVEETKVEEPKEEEPKVEVNKAPKVIKGATNNDNAGKKDAIADVLARIRARQ